jgi:hypothetical protein
MWNTAVREPKVYFDTERVSSILTSSDAAGLDVQTPPCLMQNEQVQARAGISMGSGSHAKANAMLRQWQLPWMSMQALR